MNTLQRISIIGLAAVGAAVLAPSAAMADGRGHGTLFVKNKEFAGIKGVAAQKVVAGFGNRGFGGGFGDGFGDGFGGFGGGRGFNDGAFFKAQKLFAGPKGVAKLKTFARVD
ncbi:MAG: hypothetical protein IRY90_21885 [Actinomadura rubrobrunea]|nr:hypothetical protein [Actinomadura rubrobrunea]